MSENRHARPLIIGLTGGIGSGKSTVSKLFNSLGAQIIDADEISRTLVSRGTPQFEQITAHFGPEILENDGSLNRARLREIIFHNYKEKQWLENLLHPAIQAIIMDQVARVETSYVILVVPLLLESGNYRFVDRIAVVDVPESVQLARVMNRDGSNKALAEKILASQVNRESRLNAADDIIDNNSSLEALEARVKELHDTYSQFTGH